MTLKALLTAVPKASLGIEGFIQMSWWRDLAPAGHVQRKKTGTRASELSPATMVQTPRSSDSPFSVVSLIQVRRSSMSPLRGPSGWFGETPGGSWLLGGDVMMLFLASWYWDDV